METLLVYIGDNGVARIFVWGVHFPSFPVADHIQWGGGSSIIFFGNRSIAHSLDSGIFFTFSGHLQITRRLCTLAQIQGHFPGLLTRSKHVTTSIHSRKKHLQKVWGGPWPPWPPLATPLNLDSEIDNH